MSMGDGGTPPDGGGGHGGAEWPGRRGGGGGTGGRGRPGGGRGIGDRGRRSDAARLPEELRALGRSLDAPGAADGAETMVERVLGQLLAEHAPVPVAEPPGAAERLRAVRRWTRARWRALTTVLCGLLTVLVLTPPVRAAVFDWFGFAGAEVRYDPSAVPSPGAEVPGCGHSVSLAQAERRAGFRPVVPTELGGPDAITVSGEPGGRFVVSLCWREDGRTIRLDERRASLDIAFTKTVREQPEWISLEDDGPDGDLSDPALWFPRPHLLRFVLLDPEGGRYTRQVRTAGPTLLWTHRAPEADGGDGDGDGSDGSDGADVTVRLEGVASKGRAVEIARSVK
ncbi:hypothetical protein ACIBU0_21595 [Streptomyces sp. NPDC049627]|uniref:hypothetical protein n=1 Tax=Streptomyces sp. NPDC049627 TaxID=3365595 RepID=UPI0037917857